jgi:hypothetical protein
MGGASPSRSIIRIDVTSNVTLAEVPRILLPELQGDVVRCMSVVPLAGIAFGLSRGPKPIIGSGALCWPTVTRLTPASERYRAP